MLAAVRKWKSEHSVSIKKPLRQLDIFAVDAAQAGPGAFDAALGDLLSTCNAYSMGLAEGTAPDALPAGAAPFTVVCELAEEQSE